jgi:hypothetical protein
MSSKTYSFDRFKAMIIVKFIAVSKAGGGGSARLLKNTK